MLVVPHSSDRDAEHSAPITVDTPSFSCGWHATLEELPVARIARGSLRFDMAVIGAGFTGLACARRLAELFPSASIGLIEADRIGAANSGRNSGFLLDISFYDDAAPAIQAARTRLQRGGLEELNRVVSEQRIDCDWQPRGHLYGSITEREDRWLSRMAAKYAACGEPLAAWPAERMAEVTGAKSYRRGMFHAGSVLVHPVKLVRGLAARLPGNVQVYENSGVVALDHGGARVELRTAESHIAADRVFLCANGGTPGLGHGRNRLIEVSTFAAMTPPLDGCNGAIGEAEAFGLLPCLPGSATLRKTWDNRLLVRQAFAYTPRGKPTRADYGRFLEQARETIALRWPELAPLPFDHVWSGVMCLTRNHAQLFGQIGANLYVAAFCNGAGNTSGTMAGKLVAELSAGRTSELLADQMGLPRPQWLPPGFVRGFFVNWKIAAASRRRKNVYAAARAPAP
jgi:glycine/D-amino acid oxidase-like deaminating enzyme